MFNTVNQMAYTKTWTMDDGRWTMDDGRWTMDDGRWTVDYGPFHGNAINHFVTSRIKHTPYETFLVVYFLFLQLRHAINRLPRHEISISTGHGVYFIYLQDMYHLGLARQRKSISSA